MTELAQIGVTGLAVMGRNLARTFARHGHRVAVHNRSYAKTESLVADHGDEGTFIASESMADFVASLERPRRVIIMVKAGGPTDAVISIKNDSRSPECPSRKMAAISAADVPVPSWIRSYASAISCMSAYSMPLCTIFTK